MTPDDVNLVMSFADKIGTLAMSLLVIMYLWRSWTAERAERDKERDELLAEIKLLQEARVTDAKKWAETAETMLSRALTMNGKS